MNTIRKRLHNLLDFTLKKNTHITAIILAAIVLPVLYIFHEDPALKTAGDYVLLLTAVVINAFVLTYARRNWRANPYGRAIMYSQASLATLSNLTLVTILLGPDWEYRFAVRVILFIGILVAQTRMFQLLLSTVNGPERQVYNDSHDKDTGREI